jgi:hypothetical protein
VSGSLIRQDLVPITTGYVLLMGTLAAGLVLQRRNRPAAGGRTAEPGSLLPGRRAWLRLIRHLAVTFAGGYLVLMAVVVAYYFGVARVGGNFLESAVTGCGSLLGLSAPLFLAASWLAERRERAKSKPRRKNRSSTWSSRIKARLQTRQCGQLGRGAGTSLRAELPFSATNEHPDPLRAQNIG